MKYKIIKVYGFPQNDNLYKKLEDKVNAYIDKGWRPHGSICIVNVYTSKGELDFIEVWQSLIKDNNE